MYSDLTVLVAEDDRDVREIIRRGAQARGFRINTTDSVLESFDYFPGSDILVVDLTLANGNGRQVLQKWVQQKHSPAVVISGGISKGDEDRLLMDGAWNVLGKPFGWEAFYLILERYAHIVRDRATCLTVVKLRRTVIVLAFMVVALGGVEVIPWVLKLL